MSCAKVRRQLLFYLDSELGPETSHEIARHLEACPACARRMEGERELEARFRSALGRPEERDRLAWERALAGVLSGPRHRARRLTAGAVGAAAVLLAAVLVARALAPGDPGSRRHPAGAGTVPSASLAPAEQGLARLGTPAALPRSVPLRPEVLETMKPSSLLAAALVVSVAGAASTNLLLRSDPATDSPAERGFESSARLEALARQQAQLEASVAELRELLESRSEASRTSQREAVIDDAQLERAVARVLERREREAAPAPSSQVDLGAAALLRDLLDPSLDEAERARIWKQLREGRHIDAAVAEFERRALAAPFDSLAQTELGWAYFQKMVTTSGGPETGRWGSKGADALQHALELDETNWDARFFLAQHYSYADMRGDSIRHLEVLLKQQPRRTPEAKHARAYLLLGNLRMDHGRIEAAKQAWSEGLSLFPDDDALRERLKAFD